MSDTPNISSSVEAAFKPAAPAPAQSAGEDRVRVRAYELYEKRAGQPGDAESDWYQAEAELKAETADERK